MTVPDARPATPGQTIGPFFHYALSYDRGPELVQPSATGAVRLYGTVYDGSGQPLPDAMLEIRQADPAGVIPAVEGSLRRDGMVFTGWGRALTDASGRYSFTTVIPGPSRPGIAPFFSVAIFARGLLDRLFTRAYVPSTATESAPFLTGLDQQQRQSMIAVREDDGLRFDLHLQGPHETVFLTFPSSRD